MNDAIRSLRSEARQLTWGEVPKAIRYPVAFREAVAALGASHYLDRAIASLNPDFDHLADVSGLRLAA